MLFWRWYFERIPLLLILESQNLRAVAACVIPLGMKNDCNGFKIVSLLNCFHVFKHSWNTSKDRSEVNPVILTLLWAWVAKGSSWKRSLNTVLFWLKLCLSVFLLLTCIKKAKGLYNESIKFEVQAASPYCVFLDAQCQLLIYQSTQMFQRLVVNCASTLLGNDRIAGVKSVFSKVSTQMSVLAEEMLRLFMSRPAPVVEVLRTNMPVPFTCVTCQNLHTPYFSNVIEENDKIYSLATSSLHAVSPTAAALHSCIESIRIYYSFWGNNYFVIVSIQ